MHVAVLTPDETLYSGEVKLISLPGAKGAFEILENHAPIVSALNAGVVKVLDLNGREHLFHILKGVVECLKNNISLLVEIA